MRFILKFLFVAMFFALPLMGEETKPPVAVSLHTENTPYVEGEPFFVAIQLDIDAGWHIYWKNPGDVGVPIQIEWQLPEGVQLSHLHWPYPERDLTDAGVVYRYDGELWLLAEFAPLPPSQSTADFPIKATLSWLACSETSCLPGGGEFETLVSFNEGEGVEFNRLKFEEARDKIPLKQDSLNIERKGREIHIPLPPSLGSISRIYFCPEEQNIIEAEEEVSILEKEPGKQYAVLKMHAEVQELPKALKGTLVVTGDQDWITWDIESGIEEALALNEESPHKNHELPTLKQGEQEAPLTFSLALAFAFLGGLILNLMPCVLPVVSLKILGLVKISQQSRALIFKHGLSFTLGVLVSFWILAGVLLLLQSWGHSVGWGFQLQEPLFVGILAAIIFVFSLSLFGVFEIGTGLASLAGKAEVGTSKQSGHYFGSFCSGILATAVATPCTGPFLGSAIGFAVTLPPLQSMVLFSTLGLGMASPYLAVALFPSLIRFLPKPGAWMVVFKEVLGFLMLLTTLWLMWVFAAQTESLALFALMIGLFLLSIGCWILGKWGTVASKKGVRTTGFILSGLFFALGTYAIVSSASLHSTTPPTLNDNGEVAMVDPLALSSSKTEYGWEPFSVKRAFDLIDSGRPLFVDFTARWCLICQTNDAVLSLPAIVNKMRELGVVRMKADWTKYDPEITSTLKKYGRNGVPLYLLFGTKPGEAPEILPQLLTPDTLMEHLNRIERDASGH